MNIAVFGWYHHQNAGDDRLQHCITRWFDGHTLAFLPSGRRPSVQLLRTYDAVIIGGGGIIMQQGGVFHKMAKWVKAIGIPVCLVSVSVERELSAEFRRDLREFLDVCCFAWFRDQGSIDAIGAHPKAVLAPDLTWLYPYPIVTEASAGDGIALSLRRRGNFPTERWRSVLAQLGQPVHLWPLYFEQGGDAAHMQTVLPDHTAPEEFSIDAARQSGAIVSSRFHGLLFGIQMGLPVFAVSELRKVQRFMDDHEIGAWRVAEDDPESLLRLWPQFEAAWPQLQAQSLQIRAEQHVITRQMADRLQARLFDAIRSQPAPRHRFVNRVLRRLGLGS